MHTQNSLSNTLLSLEIQYGVQQLLIPDSLIKYRVLLYASWARVSIIIKLNNHMQTVAYLFQLLTDCLFRAGFLQQMYNTLGEHHIKSLEIS